MAFDTYSADGPGGQDPLVRGCRQLASQLILQSVKDVQQTKDAVLQKDALQWLTGPQCGGLLEGLGIERDAFLEGVAQVVKSEQESKRMTNLKKGPLGQRDTPSFGEEMASRMGLLADAMSGDAAARVKYERLGQTERAATPSTKTKDVPATATDLGEVLRQRVEQVAGPRKKQHVGPTSFAALRAKERDALAGATVEQLVKQLGKLADNILASSVTDKASATAALRLEFDDLLTRVGTKSIANRRRAKNLARKALHERGLIW